MKTAAILMMFFAAAAFAQQDSPLVKAAKASGGKRKPTGKVITNADLKKAKGKLVVLPSKSEAPASAASVTDTRGPLQKQADERRARDAANARIADAQKKVDTLQKELRQIEDAYFAENDPNYRDTTIAQHFNETKQKLAGARKQLADAQGAVKR